MINLNTKLEVFFNSTSLTKKAFDFTKDYFSLQLQNTDFLYLGFYKPFNQVYFAFETPNSVQTDLEITYWNGVEFVELEDFIDDTKSLTRDGFIYWKKEQANQAKTTINSKELYWIRIKSPVNLSSASVKGINFIFVDDNDLKVEVPEITDINHLSGKTSHLLTHIAVRDAIIQELNNRDYKKYNHETKLPEDLTYWDILEAVQLKQAAKFLALSIIYFNFSDAVDDKFYQKSQDYRKQYTSALNLSRLFLDENDDGKLNIQEQKAESITIIRMKR